MGQQASPPGSLIRMPVRPGSRSARGPTWLTDTEANNVVRVDSSGLPTPIGVGDAPTGIAVGGGGVWVVDSLDDAVVRIDPDTRSVTATIRVGRSPAGVAFGAGSVWVANSGDGTVTRIDTRHRQGPVTIAVGGSPQAITIADGKAWVTVDEQSIAPSRGAPDGGTLRIVSRPTCPPWTRRSAAIPASVRDLRSAPELPRQGGSRGLAADPRGRSVAARPLARRQNLHVQDPSRLSLLATLE